jgi:hypothetical protein
MKYFKVVGLWAGIWTEDLSNMKQGCNLSIATVGGK